MSDIEDIPILDIELFLRKNNFKSRSKDVYDAAWELMQKGASYYPDSVIQWMMVNAAASTF